MLSPRDISSRSLRDKASVSPPLWGRMPPVGEITENTDEAAGQTRGRLNSSTRPVANDPKSRRAERLNSKYGRDTSSLTLHLCSRIKVLQPPDESTGQSNFHDTVNMLTAVNVANQHFVGGSPSGITYITPGTRIAGEVFIQNCRQQKVQPDGPVNGMVDHIHTVRYRTRRLRTFRLPCLRGAAGWSSSPTGNHSKKRTTQRGSRFHSSVSARAAFRTFAGHSSVRYRSRSSIQFPQRVRQKRDHFLQIPSTTAETTAW